MYITIKIAIISLTMACFVTTVVAEETHPSLFFNSSTISELRDRINREPYTTWYNSSYGVCKNPNEHYEYAFCWNIDNSRTDYADLAVSKLMEGLNHCDGCEWPPPWYLSNLREYRKYALGYDWIQNYSGLNAAAEQFIRDELGLMGYRINRDLEYNASIHLPSSPFGVGNHQTGALVTLSMIAWAIPEYNNASYPTGPTDWLNHSRTVLHKRHDNLFSENGTFVEGYGYGYWQEVLAALSEYFVLLKGFEGVDYFDNETYPRFNQAFHWQIRTYTPDGLNTMIGGRSPKRVWTVDPILVSYMPNGGWFRWANEQGLSPDWTEMGSTGYNSDKGISRYELRPISIAVYNDSVQAVALAWDGYPSYVGNDDAVFRSNILGNDSVFLQMRSETTQRLPGDTSHEHSDQGHFTIWAYGELLATEGSADWGYSRYHNIIMVDGDEVPRDAIGEGFKNTILTSWVDSTQAVYNYSNVNFTRTAMMVDDSWFIIADELDASSVHTYKWYLNGFNYDNYSGISNSGVETNWTRSDGVKLISHFLNNPTMNLYNTTYAEWGEPTTHSITAINATKTATNTRYSAILIPLPIGAKSLEVTVLNSSNSLNSGKVVNGSHQYLFLSNDNGTTETVEEMQTDAEIGLLKHDGTNLEYFSMQNGSIMTYNGTTVFNSTQRIYGALKYTSFGVYGHILGDGNYTVDVWTDVDPGNVTFNGVLLSSTNWSFNSTTNVTTANLSGSGALYMGTANLSVLSSSISFSDENPAVGDLVTVSVEIRNFGLEAEVTADFYSNGQLVGNDVVTVPSNGTAIASVTITAGVETENVTVNVSSSSTAESDVSDNVASVNVSWFKRLFDFEGGGGEFFLDPEQYNTAGVNVTNTSVLASHGSQSLNLSVVYNGSGYQEARAKTNYSAANYQNWSGYDYLLMDVYVNASDSGVKVYPVISAKNSGIDWLEVIDYTKMENRIWDNVTMDIRGWSRDNITHFYIRMVFGIGNVSAFNGSVLIDNIRLAKSGYVSSLPFPPVITKFYESSEYVEINNDVTINATVADPNNNIDSAIAVLVNGTSEIRKAMDKVGDYYYTYFTVTETKKYFYYIYVNDTTGLGGNSTWYDFTGVRPTDITNASASPPSGNESTDFNISANVIAYNAVVDTVIALISDPLGRESQIVLGNDSNIYSRIFNGTNDYNDASTYMLPGNYSFYIWANNSNGLNATSSTHTFQVNDTIAPAINSVNFTPSTANESAFITIFANVTDNKAVDAVNATVTKPGGLTTAIFLSDPDLDSVYSNIFDDTSTPGNYSVVISANDTSGNVNVSTASNFTILDSTPPVLQSLDVIPTINQTNSTFLIRSNVTDNQGVDTVKVNITHSNGYSELLNMSNVSGYYVHSYSNTSTIGKYVVWVWANDTSNNTLNSYLEPLGSVNFSVQSNITINVLSPTDNISINTSENASITVNVTSSAEVLFISAKVTKPDGLNSTIILENTSADIYKGNYSDTLLPGLYVVNITACNIAGNCSSNATSFTANDTINPTIDAFSVSHNLTDINETITFYATISDNQDDVWGRVNATVNISRGGVPVTTADLTSGAPYQGTYTPTEVGNYTALLTAVDNAGNSENESINFTVEDFSPPVVTNMTPLPGDIKAYEGKETNITLLTNENSTVVMFYKVQTDLEWSNISYALNTTHPLSIPANMAGDTVSFYLNLSDKYNNSVRYPSGSTNLNFTVDAFIEFNQSYAEINATEEEESNLTVVLNNPNSISVNASVNKTFDWVEVPGYVYMSPYSAKEVTISVTPPENLSAGNWSVLETITANGSAIATLSLDISIEGTVPQESSPAGGGGGGGGATTSFEARIKDVLAGQTFSLEIDDEDVPYLSGISLTAKQDIFSSKLSITDLEKKPSSMAEPDTSVYRYFKVSYDKNNYVESASFDFRVNRSWVEDRNISRDTVRMYRHTTGWDELSTEFIKEDDEWVYLRAKTPGFSHFSIGGVEGSGYLLAGVPAEEKEPASEEFRVPERIPETPVPTPPVTSPPAGEPPAEEKKGICGPTTVLLIAMLFPALSYIRRKSR